MKCSAEQGVGLDLPSDLFRHWWLHSPSSTPTCCSHSKTMVITLKKQGAQIPGVVRGGPTQKYLTKVQRRITFPGAFSWALWRSCRIILDALFLPLSQSTLFVISAAGLLIVVGVVRDTFTIIETELKFMVTTKASSRVKYGQVYCSFRTSRSRQRVHRQISFLKSLSLCISLPAILFRENLKKQTELGKLAQRFMYRGELVPDDVTIAMVRERLSRPDCKKGALLDGFPALLHRQML